MVHLLQDFLVDGLCDVCELEGVRCHVVDFYKHLVIVKLAVLQVGGGGDCAHTGVGVVVRVLTNTIWETLLKKKKSKGERQITFFFSRKCLLFTGLHTLSLKSVCSERPFLFHHWVFISCIKEKFHLPPPFSPTLRVPAEGRRGRTRCFLLLHTPPGCLFSSCCCSFYPPGDKHTQTHTQVLKMWFVHNHHHFVHHFLDFTATSSALVTWVKVG